MNRILYPAIFHTEDIGYSVSVPDIDGCISEGDTLEEAYANIIDAIGLYMEDFHANGVDAPKASNPNNISCDDNEFVALVEFDMIEYMKKHDTKVVKKTLTIPSWLNYMAEEQHINFSSVLQAALKQRLNIEREEA